MTPAHGNLPIRLGVLGLGRAFTLMLPTFEREPRVRLVAGHDPRQGACAALQARFGARTPGSIEAVCADPDVELVYVATPHGLHAAHVELAARHGKHVLVEKPMALTLADCTRMIDACAHAGTQLIVGHSHSFDAPVRRARALIDSGEVGEVRMIHAMQYTDFLYRPRRPEELDTARGGGVVFSQGAHQVDIVRLLGGGRVTTVRAHTGAWDRARPTEGAYSALLGFESGAFASLSYSGYAHYDSDVLMGGIGELGRPKPPEAHRQTRARWHARLEAGGDESAEAQAKAERNFGGTQYEPVPQDAPTSCQHFGPVIVSCDRADLRLQPDGVDLIDRHGTRRLAAPVPTVPRAEVVDELWAALRQGVQPRHDGRWSRATLAVCLAILDSHRLGADVAPGHQVGVS